MSLVSKLTTALSGINQFAFICHLAASAKLQSTGQWIRNRKKITRVDITKRKRRRKARNYMIGAHHHVRIDTDVYIFEPVFANVFWSEILAAAPTTAKVSETVAHASIPVPLEPIVHTEKEQRRKAMAPMSFTEHQVC